MTSRKKKLARAKALDFAERVGSTFAAAFIAFGFATSQTGWALVRDAAIAGLVSAGKFVLIELNRYNQGGTP